MQATATQLRHKSLDTTRRVYTHVEQMDQQAKDLGKLLDYNLNPCAFVIDQMQPHEMIG